MEKKNNYLQLVRGETQLPQNVYKNAQVCYFITKQVGDPNRIPVTNSIQFSLLSMMLIHNLKHNNA